MKSHSRILYLQKKSLHNFSIVEKETSEGTDYWIIQNWPWKTSRKKDFSEKGLAEKVNSVKHTACRAILHTLAKNIGN